jgi:hypothetical protein
MFRELWGTDELLLLLSELDRDGVFLYEYVKT